MKKIKNIQVRDARGREVHLAPGRPFKLDEALLMAIEQSKGGLKLLKAAGKIQAAQSVDAPEIILEDAEVEDVAKAAKACQAFTDILREQVESALSGASEAIVEVK